MRARVRTPGARSCAGKEKASEREERATGAYGPKSCCRGSESKFGDRQRVSQGRRNSKPVPFNYGGCYRRLNSSRTSSTTFGIAAATSAESPIPTLAELTVTRIQVNSVSRSVGVTCRSKASMAGAER